MASLQFRYDGYGRPERMRNMGFFPPRYYYHNYNSQVPQEAAEEKTLPKPEKAENSTLIIDQSEKPLATVTSKEEKNGQAERGTVEETLFSEEVSSEKAASEEINYQEKKASEGETVKAEKSAREESIPGEKESMPGERDNSAAAEESTFSVSEELVANLTATESNLFWVKGKVDSAKGMLDDLVYKLESFTQIMEIVRANEERRVNGSQVQTASLKTSKDSVDELLELFQGPVFLNLLRQFLVSTFAKKGREPINNSGHKIKQD